MTDATALEALLRHLKSQRGFDFTGYKRSTLQRRIAKRMAEVGIADAGEYLDHLEADQREFEDLFNTILINVTGFMRDPEAWRYLREEVLPRMLESLGPDQPVRVWSAGCASGEEPYTLAMVLAEALGEDAYKARVKIYATDADQDALAAARRASYSTKALEAIPEEWRDRYFERVDGRYAFRADLRRTVIFGRNDLVQDAPISRIDLLVCRNVLMYFNAETQARILERFNFALRPDGHLFLGKSEMLITHAELFKPVSLNQRVFTRVRSSRLHERLAGVAESFVAGVTDTEPGMRVSAFDAAPVAQVVVDRAGRLALANAEARRTFALSDGDLGRPVQDLELSYRPVELRSLMQRLADDVHPLEVDGVRYRAHNEAERVFKVSLLKLTSDGDETGVSVTYLDVTADRALQDELRRSKQDLEAAYEELQSTVEELETTNEELQSTNEELETTNEELQSTNEELETMNEELQSTNEELETTNEELRQRGLELNRVNSFLETILTSLGVSVVVVDGAQEIRIWNSYAEGMWGLRPEEAEGQGVLSLDIGFPVERLREPLRACLDGRSEREELTADAVDRRGRAFECHVTVLPLRRDGSSTGAIVLMEAVKA